MFKWFSFSDMKVEIQRIRWPKRKDMVKDVTQVLVFCLFFGCFFVVCEVAVSFLLRLIGIGV